MVQATDYPWNGKVVDHGEPQGAEAIRRADPRARIAPSAASTRRRRRPTASRRSPSTARRSSRRSPGLRGDHADLEGRRHGRARAADAGAARPRQREDRRPRPRTVALRYGPLVYNIEKVDQDIDAGAGPVGAARDRVARELLGGVTVITGTFADGAPMMAVPNYARYNRNPPAPPPAPPQPPPPAAGAAQRRRRHDLRRRRPRRSCGSRRSRPVVPA